VGRTDGDEAEADTGAEAAFEDLVRAEIKTLAPKAYLDETDTERTGMIGS
jgi:hypothetical protein